MSSQGYHITVDTIQTETGCTCKIVISEITKITDITFNAQTRTIHATATLLYPKVLEIQGQVHSAKKLGGS